MNSSHFNEGSRSTLYTIEISEEEYHIYIGYGYPKCFIVRNQRDKVCFKLEGGGTFRRPSYRIYNAQNIELGELKAGVTKGTIREKETSLESIIEISKVWKGVLSDKPDKGIIDLSVITPSGQYFLSDRMVSDKAFSYNLSDSQAHQVLSIERPRHSGKGNIWGVIRNFGYLDPFLACAIGVSLSLYPIFTMKSPHVKLLDKSTEIKVERKRRLGNLFIYRDDSGREIFRGKRLGLSILGSSSYKFTDPSGNIIGELSRKRRSSEWVITDSQRDITGTLDLSDIRNAGNEDKPSNRLIVSNETFSFGNFVGFNRELYDRNGNLSFTIFGFNTLFTLDIKKSLSPNFWCFLSASLIMEFFIPKPRD